MEKSIGSTTITSPPLPLYTSQDAPMNFPPFPSSSFLFFAPLSLLLFFLFLHLAAFSASSFFMGFFVEDPGVIVSHLIYKAALVLAVMRWALSWALRFRNRTHLPSSSSGNDSVKQSHPAPSPQQICEGLFLTTFGDIMERVPCVCDTCAVCLTKLKEHDEVRELRNCCHVFHKECIDRWVDHQDPEQEQDQDQDQDQDDNHKTCPLCRAPLLTSVQNGYWAPTERSEPSWAVERILYLFGDDLLTSC